MSLFRHRTRRTRLTLNISANPRHDRRPAAASSAPSPSRQFVVCPRQEDQEACPDLVS